MIATTGQMAISGTVGDLPTFMARIQFSITMSELFLFSQKLWKNIALIYNLMRKLQIIIQ